VGEVLLSATGLAFAHSQNPALLQGGIMNLWRLALRADDARNGSEG
jgi:dipeptide/tripeptide permease